MDERLQRYQKQVRCPSSKGIGRIDTRRVPHPSESQLNVNVVGCCSGYLTLFKFSGKTAVDPSVASFPKYEVFWSAIEGKLAESPAWLANKTVGSCVYPISENKVVSLTLGGACLLIGLTKVSGLFKTVGRSPSFKDRKF